MALMQQMLSSSDDMVVSILKSTYPALASAVYGPITYMAILYWALYGYRIYAGNAAFTWKDLVAKVAMTSAVFSTLKWGGLASTIYLMFTGFAEGTAATIMAGKPTATMVDALVSNVDAASATLRAVDWYQIAALLDGFLLWLINYVFAIAAILLLVIAKFGMAITMLLCPLFVGFMFFDATRQWSVNWINKMMNFALIYILAAVVIKFGFAAFGFMLDKVKEAGSYTDARMITGDHVLYIAMLEGVLLMFLLQVKGWAAALSNGMAIQGASQILSLATNAMQLANGRRLGAQAGPGASGQTAGRSGAPGAGGAGGAGGGRSAP